jgi:hypothetical protein
MSVEASDTDFEAQYLEFDLTAPSLAAEKRYEVADQ